ncbi:MAG TPA: response regulator transcription factor [Devosia sp.]|uniref:response regulator transcription factor n=1 Tax=Devosia sp. TaxID=1871048 RepID=UPI002DDCE7A0|nr:response regulator transcription factor [Devosia sp.]HEV2514241.1 response regulator transcription factor [Devosia sp.]
MTEGVFSPKINRDRLIYITHPDPRCGKDLCDEFLVRGFQISLVPDLDAIVRLAQIRRPDLVIVPLCSGEDGDGDAAMAALMAIRALHLSIKMYVLAPANARAELISDVLKAGACYAFSPPYAATQIVHAVEQLLRNDLAVSGKDGFVTAVLTGFGTLTRREREVLQLIVEGRTNKEIGLQVGISYRTVEVHRRHLLGKTGARNTAELVRLAVEG